MHRKRTDRSVYAGIPVLRLDLAVAVLLLNLVLPGTGTGVAAWRGGGRKLAWKGVWQLALALLVVGWVWALVTGVKVVANAREARGFTRVDVGEKARPPVP